MTEKRRLYSALAGALATWIFAGAGSAMAQSKPVPVSPGGLEQPGAVGVRCPTLSWSPGDGPVELVLYDMRVSELSDATFLEAVRKRPPRISKELPAGVTSWSASGNDCLSPGVYAWSVRPAAGSPLDWSEALLLEIRPPMPREVPCEPWSFEATRSTESSFALQDQRLPEGDVWGIRTSTTPRTAVSVPSDSSAVTIDGEGNVFAGSFVRLCPNGKPFYRDDDNDGFGDPLEQITACSALGYVANNIDCDDTDDLLNHETSYAHCRDGRDNDCDTFIDCEDFSCDAFGGAEADNCSDGYDNDCDSYVDCDDFDCQDGGGTCL